jgi:hypothetical protein
LKDRKQSRKPARSRASDSTAAGSICHSPRPVRSSGAWPTASPTPRPDRKAKRTS